MTSIRPTGTTRARCIAAALAECPPEVEVIYIRRNLSGRVKRHQRWPQERYTMWAPRPVTRRALNIFLHECAHVRLHHFGSSKPTHRQEFEAEMWSFQAMHRHKIAVPWASYVRAQKYVAYRAMRAVRRGAKVIDPMAMKFMRHDDQINIGAQIVLNHMRKKEGK